MMGKALKASMMMGALALAGCGAGDFDSPNDEDVIGDVDQDLITCTGPQGDAYGNGPDGPQVVQLIKDVFGSHADTALRVARCESGYWSNCCSSGGGTKAHYNYPSQYKGLFQMGEAERAKYGFNWCAGKQVHAAYQMFLDRGWSPWSCF